MPPFLQTRKRLGWPTSITPGNWLSVNETSALAGECRQSGREHPEPAPPAKAYFKCDDAKPAAAYTTPEAESLAKSIISYQTPSGGWSKAKRFRTQLPPPAPKGGNEKVQRIHMQSP